MSRPYTVAGAGYLVPTGHARRACRTRNHAGYVYTTYRRSPQPLNLDSKRPPGLILYGTTDTLRPYAAGYKPLATRAPCPCCGAKQAGR